uniref:Carrier domain-containing protein n=1 Tax=Kwoniella pini CBS 10737 TaxID=1296096 RepID=A0A1B9I1Q1_9TREE|nr:uncharacterized protein I206_03956 [Kwoniella pini CBS 10737]OCF49435.1 hypothetical protein I206_03956 [Kwoniella pini CBS 10737]
MTLSYLVSTAGHAQYQNEQYPHDVENILQLINDGAKEFEQEKVVGFTSRTENAGWTCDCYSFPELLDLSSRLVGGLVSEGVNESKDNAGIVSLLCPTGLDFLLGWIALMRMGYGVVLIAPQCSPSAVAHLYKASASTKLIYHPKYTELAHSARQLDATVTSIPIPLGFNDLPPTDLTCAVHNNDSVSHIFHTSGTSGTPKPIPNTHSLSVSVLPRRALPSYSPSSSSTTKNALPSESAAFTTTPLFHGGISDLLRAWMARSMIYFYPTSDVPITTGNVVQAVAACLEANRFRVTSFLSVPYILSTLVQDPEGPGIQLLKNMDYVSTGGAPLDTTIGNMMVEKGIKLVSRLGSSECGFLLSSHRDYSTEKDWEWLRNDSPYADALVFEQLEGESTPGETRYEMVVTDRWLSKTKSNRGDGSYATGDLYRPHPTKKDVWKYAGRGDDVIVLSNGEKASPGPIESVLRSSSFFSDVLVVGSEQSQLGVLLFPREIPASSSLLGDIAPLIADANASSPSFAQITKDMCYVVNSTTKTLPKSSKGTIQRGVAYDVFREEIDQLYQERGGQVETAPKRSLVGITIAVERIVKDAVASRLKVDTLGVENDLFSWGVDSLMATRIRTSLQKQLNTGGTVLPNNVVFEKPTINSLSQFIFDLQEHKVVNGIDIEETYRLMESLVEKYGFFGMGQDTKHLDRKQDRGKVNGKTVLLTGGTGSLGSFLLNQFSQPSPNVIDNVICLVRAEDDDAAYKRTFEGLSKRGFGLDPTFKVKFLAADLVKPDLGLSPAVYKGLVDKLDIVIHAAWPVHFTSSLVSFENSIEGTRNLLDLVAKTEGGKLYFCSSLASVLGKTSPRYLEEPSHDPSTASPIGYSQSKWVTERICGLASESGVLKDRVHIVRVGQLCGDTQHGYWNEKEGWPLLIRTAEITGSLPLLQEKPSWLPVDLASRAIIDITTSDHPSSPLIYHVVHPNNLEWQTVLNGLHAAGLSFKRVKPQEWLNYVDASVNDLELNPSKQMLHMWTEAYGDASKSPPEIMVDISNSSIASSTIRNLPPVDEDQVKRMVCTWRSTGFLRS